MLPRPAALLLLLPLRSTKEDKLPVAAAAVAAAAVTCPATVVIGLGDKMTPPKGGRALAAAIPGVHVVELADTGHSMMTEDPRAVKKAIVETATG